MVCESSLGSRKLPPEEEEEEEEEEEFHNLNCEFLVCDRLRPATA
jgi:hypothetical protein